jgi:hypothetical protein
MSAQKKDQNLVITKNEHKCPKERPIPGHYETLV